jgi:hypothetical protein
MATRKPGAAPFFLGFGLLGLAAVVSVFFGVVIGGTLVLGALALMVRGLTAGGRKAAGALCAGCPRTIVFEHEAEFCDVCDAPVHARCVAGHRSAAHPLGSGAYR